MARVNVAAAQVKSAKPSRTFGQTAQLVASPNHYGELHVPLSLDIPASAVVTRADLVLRLSSATTTSRDVTVQRNGSSPEWRIGSVTWQNKPGVIGSPATVTVPAQAADTAVTIDLKADVQAMVSGTYERDGWRLSATANTYFHGPLADHHKPRVLIEWVEPGDPPSDLSPAGIVSNPDPLLTFDVAEGTTAIQVQFSTDPTFSVADWDSGEVATTAGLLDTAATLFPGLVAEVPTYWRARSRAPFVGLTDWSDAAEMMLRPLPTVTILAPGSTTGDKSFPIQWASDAAEQIGWEVIVRDMAGDEVARRDGAGADTLWTPRTVFPKKKRSIGSEVEVEVRVFDSADRVPTATDPGYASATVTTELVAIGDAVGPSWVGAMQEAAGSPVALVSWTAITADAWQIVRDGEWLERIVDGTVRSWRDVTAAPYHQHSYQVLPVSNGEVSPNSPGAVVTTRPAGAWLLSRDSGVMLGDSEVVYSAPEYAISHAVLGDRPAVRRRISSPPPVGTVIGTLADGIFGDDADVGKEFLGAVKDAPPASAYRLVWGDVNLPVTVSDLTVGPGADSGKVRVHSVSFGYSVALDEDWDED